MDQQSSIVDARSGLNLVLSASLMLPSDEYSTVIVNFPANNGIPAWGTKGRFSAAVETYVEGKHRATLHLPVVDQDGMFEAHLDELLPFTKDAQSGLLIVRLWHEPKIPVDLYLSHIHRATGTHIIYPAAGFMGDRIYQNVHNDQLENNLFWSGPFGHPNSHFFLNVLNPYTVPFSFQVSLFPPDGRRIQSEVMKIGTKRTMWVDVENLFKEQLDRLGEDKKLCSVCISAQFKTIAYAVLKDRGSGIITTLDHLHQFTMV